MTTFAHKHYHLVGVAGVGMSGLAQLLLAEGAEVSGSDRFRDRGEDLDVLHKLENAGLRLVAQDGSGLKPETEAIVVSTAIEDDNPDRLRALELKIPIVHRAEMLACMAAGRKAVAVTGTSGKSTVTGMIGWIFECLGMDPTVVNGGALVDWRSEYRIGNVRVGRSNVWIFEADESDKSLLRFQPDWAVITNVSKDHFEVNEVRELFQRFASQVRRGIVCGPGVREILEGGGAATLLRGLDLAEEVFIPEAEGGFHSFWYKGLTFRCPLIGRHNAENAFAAVVLCDRLGLDLAAVRNALSSFSGIERRLQPAGGAHGVIVVDDYAHNPAKIRAAWQAVAPMHARILGVWRPHGFAPLRSMMNELAEAFTGICRPSDRVFILPVFYSGGTANQAVTSEDLVNLLKRRNVEAWAVRDYDALIHVLAPECRAGDCVLCMGARDPYLPVFSRRLVATLESL